jgi:hypothetical protein
VGALGLGLVACGSGSSAAPDEATAAGDGGGAPRASAGASASSQPPKIGAADRCRTQLGGLLGSMDRLRDDLVAGVSYKQYVGELKDVRGVYDSLPVKQLQIGCLRRAGTPAEKGFNEYIEAGNTWGDCVEVVGCEGRSIEAELQHRWRVASKLLTEAQDGLARK